MNRRRMKLIAAAITGTFATVVAGDPAPTKTPAKDTPAEVKRQASGVEGQKAEEVKRVDVKTPSPPPPPPPPPTTLPPPVIRAVKGIDGIKGAKLDNLQAALKLQQGGVPPKGNASVAAGLAKGPATQPPTEPPIEDGRDLQLEVPPEEIGGS